jgi:L-rhamnonate dehydratase
MLPPMAAGMPPPRIVAVRAFVPVRDLDRQRSGDQETGRPSGGWARRPIASPLSHYPGREVRITGVPDWVGYTIVEVEADNGAVGTGITVGGAAAAWIIEGHLAQFVVGQRADDIATIWDLMWRGSLFYGRRGVVVHALSAIDLALWDLRGQLTGQPVHELIGGPARDELPCYATTFDAAAARELGFIGVKLPMPHGMASGRAGLRANVELFAAAREAAGEDMFLAFDCWMAMDVERSVELAHELLPFRPAWLEECLPPDDYWGYRTLRQRFPGSIAVAGGEHEATRWGFRTLTEFGHCDILQPDPTWCGGLTELLRIIADAEMGGRRVIMHGSSSFGHQVSIARASIPFAETFLTGSSDPAPSLVFGGLLAGEPLPQNGRLSVAALRRPGFGLTRSTKVEMTRPFLHGPAPASLTAGLPEDGS